MKSATRKAHIVGALLALAYLGLLVVTSWNLGMSRDESFYVEAADRYAVWFELAFEQVFEGKNHQAFEQATIDRYWQTNHEHPSLAKSLFAFGKMANQHFHLFEQPTLAYRFGGQVLSALCLWLLVVFGTRYRSLFVGVLAALLFAFMPRVFYHSHLDCFDMPIVFFLTLSLYAYWRSLHSKRWVILFGLSYGLALATKHNSWILPGVFLIHSTVLFIGTKRTFWQSFRWLLASVVISVPLFILSWPWLWNDGLERFGWYANFHLKHVHYTYAYLGKSYFEPPFPMSVPFISIMLTVPLTTLVLLSIGLGTRARGLFPAALIPGKMKHILIPSDSRATTMLLLGALLSPIVVIAMPSSPIFGATKHWMAAYPIVALFAAEGLHALLATLAKLMRLQAIKRLALVSLGVAFALGPSLSATRRNNGFGLSYYNPLLGGARSAARLGMNRQFWGFNHGQMGKYFASRLPKGGSVWIGDATRLSWEMAIRDGLIPRNITPARNGSRADIAIVHYERHFQQVETEIMNAFGVHAPAYVLTYDAVPIVLAYENPSSRNLASLTKKK